MFPSLFYLSPLSQLSLLHLPPLSLSSLTLSFLDLINLNKFASSPSQIAVQCPTERYIPKSFSIADYGDAYSYCVGLFGCNGIKEGDKSIGV